MLWCSVAIELTWDLVLQECGSRVPVLAKEDNNDSEQESVYYASWKRVAIRILWCCLLYWIQGRTGVACLSLLIHV